MTRRANESPAPKPLIVWTPQPKQLQFQQRPEYEALYGGSAGGGKSDALLTEALRQVGIPHYRGLLVRKTYPQLTEMVDRSRALYGQCFPGAKYNSTGHFWRFASGAQIHFGTLHREADKHNYQGKRYDFIGVDELTHFTWSEYSYFMSRNRPGGPGTRVYIRATTNPGGIGHGWVKDRFISAAPPMTPITSTYEVITPEGAKITVRRKRIFVPATVFDNKILLRNDPGYIGNLAMLPEAEKAALLYGSWDSFSGQVFREWRNDPARYGDQRWTHVIAPFRIPKRWKIYRGLDWGYKKPFSVGWYAADPDGRVIRVREYYGCTGAPDVGVEMHPARVAAEIRRIEAEDPNLRGHDIYGIADPAIFQQSGGESTADLMAKPPHGVYWSAGDHSRLSGKMQLHYRLAFDAGGWPMFQVFDTCSHFIRTLPGLVYDTRDVEDVNSRQEDHLYDECRYVLMENPISPRENVLRRETADDPLGLLAGSRETGDAYRYYRV